MIAGFLGALPAIALGWIIVRLLMPSENWKPAWLRWVMEISLGTGIGLGLTSCLYFTLLWAGVLSRTLVMASEAVLLLAAVALLLVRRGRTKTEVPPAPGFSWNWVLRLAAVLALLLVALDFGQSTGSNPNGEWDAFSIWNVRARFLAGGAGTWRTAISNQMAGQMVGANHPSYPLLVSSSVTRLWVLANDVALGPGEPAVLSLLFSLATAGLLCGAVAWIGAESVGLLALLVLFATEGFVSQVASQYSDVPLSFYILGAIALVAAASTRAWPTGLLILAGLCAGLSTWTKNEGTPFLVITILVVAWRAGIRPAAWLVAGALPGGLMTAAFKFVLHPPGEAIFPKTVAEAFSKIIDPTRWLQIAVSFARNIWELGVPWAHPVLLMAIVAFALRFAARKDLRSRWWLVLPVAGLLAVDFGVYLLTTAQLNWHLDTSNSRLFVQVWPALLFAFFVLVQPPVSAELERVLITAGRRAEESERESTRKRAKNTSKTRKNDEKTREIR